MLMMARPTVVLPQPDSPTTPSVSPFSSVNDTPSTARTSPVFLNSRPPNTGNLTFRFLTSRMCGIFFVGDSVEVAADEMARRALDQHRLDIGARLEPVRATRGEFAAGRQIENVGHRARNRRQALGPGAVDARQRAEQPARVRMHRISEQLLDGRELLNFAAVHHCYAIARLGDHG